VQQEFGIDSPGEIVEDEARREDQRAAVISKLVPQAQEDEVLPR
jgi:hypothetical protein